MKKNLVICDEDLRYATRLGENISAREDGSLNVFVCSELEHALKLAQGKTVDILLISETYLLEERSQILARNVYVLVKGAVWEGGEEEHPIFKYQSASDILREIFSQYSDEEKTVSYAQVHKGKAKMIAVYSPIHRIGKSTFAKALAKAYATEKKTLYLNLEEYAGEVLENGGGLGEILYYMRQGDKNLRLRIDALVQEKEGYYYLLPIELSEDLKDISVTEWLDLFRELLATSGYERVILDIGDSVQGLLDILELCDCVYMPILRDDISEKKIQRLEKNINRMKFERLPKHICRFVMPENIEEYAKMRKREDT